MSKITKPEEMLANLANVEQILDRLSAAEAAKMSLEAEIADAGARIDALQAENAELKDGAQASAAAADEMTARIAELEAQLAESAEQLAPITAGVEALKLAEADFETYRSESVARAEEAAAKIADLEAALAEATAEVAEAEAEVEVAEARAEAVSDQLEIVAEALGVKGIAADGEELSEAADADHSAEIVAEYKRLATSPLRSDRAAARSLYNQHQAEIAAALNRENGGPSKPSAGAVSADEISEAEWAKYDAWRAEHTLLSSPAHGIKHGEHNRRAWANRMEYKANRELFDRCTKARRNK